MASVSSPMSLSRISLADFIFRRADSATGHACTEMFFRIDELEKSFSGKSLYFLADVNQGVTGVVICFALG